MSSSRFSKDGGPWRAQTRETAFELDATVRHTMQQLAKVRAHIEGDELARALDELDAGLQAFASLHRHAMRLSSDMATEGVER